MVTLPVFGKGSATTGWALRLNSLAALFGGVALLMVGHGALGTFVSLRLTDQELDQRLIGLVVSAYFAGMLAGALVAASIIRNVGQIRAFAAFGSLFSAAAVAHTLILDVWVWTLLRAAEGFFIAGLFMCVESWLNGRATPDTRGKLLSIYMMVTYSTQAAGQFLINLFPPDGPQLFVLISILLSVALVPVLLTRVAPPELPDVHSFNVGKLLAASPLGMLGTFMSGAITATTYGLAPVFGRAIGLGTAEITVFMSMIILGGVLLQFPLGALSDLFDRRKVIIALFIAVALVSFLLSAVALDYLKVLIPLAILFGGVTFALYPLCVAHTNDWLDDQDFVSASGGLLLTYSAGAIVGPLVAAGAMAGSGPAGFFLFHASIGVGVALFGIWRITRRASPTEQAPFQIVPRTTPAALPLSPSAQEAQLSLDFSAPVEDERSGAAVTTAPSDAPTAAPSGDPPAANEDRTNGPNMHEVAA